MGPRSGRGPLVEARASVLLVIRVAGPLALQPISIVLHFPKKKSNGLTLRGPYSNLTFSPILDLKIPYFFRKIQQYIKMKHKKNYQNILEQSFISAPSSRTSSTFISSLGQTKSTVSTQIVLDNFFLAWSLATSSQLSYLAS